MFCPYLMASFVLVGLSAARPQQIVTPDTAYTSSTTLTGTVASFDGQISSPAQLSKRHHHHHHDDEGGDWDDIASQGIGQIGGVLHSIIGIFGPHDDEKTESITTTVTENPDHQSSNNRHDHGYWDSDCYSTTHFHFHFY
ncbi:hypothetical protein LA080_011750 [Diaporthe eres]|nr:hypothetical protein LA080_011750 [Diaporthe eres]